jgi:hypothetical protein
LETVSAVSILCWGPTITLQFCVIFYQESTDFAIRLSSIKIARYT